MNSLTAWISRVFVDDDSRSKWRRFLGVAVLVGAGAIVLRTGGGNPAVISASVILAGASMFVGVMVGFLFGIPKTVRRRAESGAAPVLSEGDYQPNTNLEEISDWLTKMLVGIGLIELREIPGMIDGLARYWEPALGGTHPQAYGAGLMVYFSTIGFLIGYLWTRLALVGDFIEKDPRRLISQILMGVAQSAQNNPETTERSPSRQVVTPDELDAAQKLASLSAESRISVEELRAQVRALAVQYEAVRASMTPGAERTRRMEVIASQMRSLSIAAYPLLSDLVQSDSPGDRLAAVTFMQTRPNPTYYSWLADRLCEEKPFIGYHAAVALQHAVRSVTAEQRASLWTHVRHAVDCCASLPDNADRVAVLKHTLSLLEGASA